MATNQQPHLIFDLNKAMLDKSKLVQVEITVQGKNGTFTRKQWKNPADVKSTDKVIGNQNVLDEFNKRMKAIAVAQQNAKGQFDPVQFDSLKLSKDKTKAMEYAKKCGVQWKEHATNSAINWMRCIMAVNQLNNVSVKVSAKHLNTANISSSWDSMTKKEKMSELMKNNSRSDLMEFAKANGITWKEDAKDGINWMRASMAIQKYIEGKNLVDLNTNAKLSVDIQKKQDAPKPEPKKESDKIEVPANATTRQKNLIGLINNTTDESDLRLFKACGIVAEDDDAKAFLKDKMLPAYTNWKNGKTSSNGGRRRYGSYYYRGDFAKDSAKAVGGISTFKGIPEKLLAKGFRDINRQQLTDLVCPRSTTSALYMCQDYNVTKSVSSSTTLQLQFTHLRENFSQYTQVLDAQGNGITNKGYAGPSDLKAQKFDASKDGVCLALDYIGSQQPQLSDKCAKMKKTYSEMMAIMDNNYASVDLCFTKRPGEISRVTDILKKRQSCNKKVMEVLKSQGLDDSSASSTIYNMYNTSEVYIRNSHGDRIADGNNGFKKINLHELCGKDSDGNYILDTSVYSSDKQSILSALNDHSTTGLSEKEQAEYDTYSTVTLDKYKQVQKKALEFTGQKLVDSVTGTDIDISGYSSKQLDDFLSKSSAALKQGRYKAVDNSTETDDVLANLSFFNQNAKVMNTLMSNASYDCSPSTANQNGSDYSQNVRYMTNETSLHGKYHNMYYSSESKKNSQEVNKLIDDQLHKIDTLSPEFLKGMRDFIKENGDDKFEGYNFTDDESALVNKTSSYNYDTEESINGFKDTPIYDLITKQMQYVANFCPQMVNTRTNTNEKMKKYIEKCMDYTPYDFSQLKSRQQAINPQQPNSNAAKLRKMRQEVADAVHCSLSTCDATQNADNETYVKRNWDKGARDSSGKRLYGYISAVFNKSYEVKNSLQEEKMLENAKKLGETPKTYFHGTNHSGATGILGVDGKFVFPKDSSDAAKKGLKYAGGMLGAGVYLADMAGKSAGYFSSWGSSYGTNGVLMICKAVLGKHFSSGDYYSSRNAPQSYRSVSLKAGTNTGRTILRADEWCVREEDYIFPKYIMDMSCKRR